VHPLLVPALLMFAALSQRKGEAQPQAATKPGTRTRPSAARPRAAPPPTAAQARQPMPAARAMPAKHKPSKQTQTQTITHEPEHPNVIPAPPQAQAAVDAAMSQVVKDMSTPPATPAQQAMRRIIDAKVAEMHPTPPPTPMPPPQEPDPKKRAAAQQLLAFLIKTGRFGTLAHDTKHKKDRPKEIKAAQLALGVSPDGIVGPETTAAAEAVGVALPPRPAN